MNREKLREFKSNLLKEERDFKSLLYTNLLDSKEDMEKIVNLIQNDIKITDKIYKNWLPKDFESLSAHICTIKNCDIGQMFSWTIFLINLFKEKIEIYVEHKKLYERFLLSKDYENAYNEINFIEREICVSLWSTQQTLLLNEYIGGLIKNKEKLEEYAEKAQSNFWFQIIINFYSRQAELGVSYENYQESVKTYLKRFDKKTDSSIYLNYKINLNFEVDYNSMAIPLYTDSQMSIIDLYETAVDLLQQIYALEDKSLELSEIINKINIGNDYRLNNIKFNYTLEVNNQYLSNNDFYPILELYTIGRYNEAKIMLEKYLKIYFEDFQAHILWIKCLIKLQEPINSDIRLLNDFYNIYTLNNNYNDSYLDVALKYKLLNGTSWKYKLRGVLDRKQNTTDSRRYKILTYLNDMYITPSYIFNMCDKENCVACLKKLRIICPAASDLFLHVYQDVSIENIIEDEFRKNFYSALSLIEKKENINAISELELLLSKQNPQDFYHLEKIGRKLFSAYVAEKDYTNILFLTVNMFFKNNNLIKKFDLQNIKKELYRINESSIKADIRYPIFTYIIDKSNKNQLKISYSNYMDYNNFKNIEDVIIKEKRQCQFLSFFLYNICVTNIIKRDIRVIESGTNADDIRISILRYLMETDIEKSKKYYEEISEIMTRKNIRNKIKQINHSRIFVDSSNIKKKYIKVFNEEFDKYIIIKNFGDNIKGLDMNDVDNTEAIINLISEIKSKREDIKYNQEHIVIKHLSERILEQLLYNTEFGLNTFLSSRIRHGFCKSSIKSSFEECHLLSQKRHELDNSYNINNYWEEKLGSNSELFLNVRSALGEFTKNIEDKIYEVKNIWIKIKNKDEKEGFFDYTLFISSFMLYFSKEQFDDFDSFYKALVEFFDQTTNNILNAFRNKIKTDLYDFFVNQLNILEERIVALNNPEVSVVINNINQCKSKISNSMIEFSEIFYLEKNEYADFSFNDIIETCIEINRNTRPAFKSAKVKKEINDNFIIKGSSFPFFVDMVNQVIANAIEHSGLHMDNLKLFVYTKEGINNELLNDQMLSYKPKQFEFKQDVKYLNINISNTMTASLNPDEIKNKIKEIFQKFDNREILKKYSQTEGGSGLYKLYTTLQYHIGENYMISYDVTKEKFMLNIIIEIDNLIVKGVKDEDIAG